jgi:serine/threonine kinase 38
MTDQRPRAEAKTDDKVDVAKSFSSQYYHGMVHDERKFVMSHTRAKEKKLCAGDFERLKVIGAGAFGEVCLCVKRDDPKQQVMAMKVMRKSKMIEKGHVKHVRAERDLMVESRKRTAGHESWVVDLHYSFQDDEFLYFVMEFCPGGDMMTWLIRLEIFRIEVARFYTAELVLAVQSIHQLDYAHRDLKPDNILFTASGHIKLTDFGLSKHTGGSVESATADGVADPAAGAPRGHSRILFGTTVGSPGYTAPEVIQGRGYGIECDWWSVGIILYEMLVGYPPFAGDENAYTGHKIVRWREFLEFPEGVDAIDPKAQDLISRLLCDVRDRLDFRGITAHPFFQGLDWSTLRTMEPPLKMNVTGPADTRNFDEEPQTRPLQGTRTGPSDENRYLFSGFTSRFENTAASTRAGARRTTRPGIPSFEGIS